MAATCLFLSRKARTIISMLALNPQTGESSGASLGVPFKALLHRHNAAVHIGSLGTALQRGESSVAGTKKESPKGLSQNGGYLLSHNAVQYHRRC